MVVTRSQARCAATAILSATWFFIACGSVARAGDWPGFRGPTGLGYTDEKAPPLTWDGKTRHNILWSTPLEGGGRDADFRSPGHSSPIVWHDRVFITTNLWPAGLSKDERKTAIPDHHVLCFRADDGKPLWDTSVPPGKCVVDNPYHGYAVPTPVTDGTRVFALFGSGVIAALDFDGKVVWREELPHVREVDGGTCSSPILYGDTVIVPALTPGAGLRALDQSSGALKWEQKSRDRNTMTTPVVLPIGGRDQLIHYAGGIQGLDPKTGDLIWACHKVSVGTGSPAFGSGLLYTDSGRGGRTGAAVDPTGTGDVSMTHVRWTTEVAAPAGSSPIIIGDYLYRITNGSKIGCWNVRTGESVYLELASKITPSASPVATADGRIYFASARRSYVIKAGPKFEVLATNLLEGDGGEHDYTTPAFSGGRIFIKGRTALWCIGEK